METYQIGSVMWARVYARQHLGDLTTRWLHTEAVARKATRVARLLPVGTRRPLIAGAYLHDIGYSRQLNVIGWHPLDGAEHLRRLGLERLAGLVAYHSSSAEEAVFLGLEDRIRDFPQESSLISDALAYCDLTTDPLGEDVTMGERIEGVVDRYGADDPASKALGVARPALDAALVRVEDWMERQSGFVRSSPEK